MRYCCGEVLDNDADTCPFCGKEVFDRDDEDLDLIRRREIADYEDSRGL